MAIAPTRSREIQLFDPPPDAIYTIEATSHLVSVSRRTILVYCKYHLLSPATVTTDQGYYFDGDAIRTLRRIEVLRTICGDDLAGIKIILDLTAALDRLQSDVRLLSRKTTSASAQEKARSASSIRPRRKSMKFNPRRKENEWN
jgi:MerR family transcriptional regulator/heat shock protein HspR